MMRVVLLHAPEDADWARLARARLRGPQVVMGGVALGPHALEQLAQSQPDLVVVVLTHAWLREPSAPWVVEQACERLPSHWLTIPRDRDLERAIPRYLQHIYAMIVPGDQIAALGAKVRRPVAPPRVPPHGPGLVVGLVTAVALVAVAGLGVATHELWRPAAPVEPTTVTREDAPAALATPGPDSPDPATAAAPTATASPSPAPPERPTSAPQVPTRVAPPHLERQPHPIAKATPLELVYLEGGSFTMGARGSTNPNKRPHEVTVAGFWIGDAEVTQSQWTAMMGTNPSDLGAGIRDDYPVQNVSWEQAVDFCNRLSIARQYLPCYAKEAGQWQWQPHCDGFRLPTEAEWEYAARAGTSTKYHYGDGMSRICKYGNVSDRTAEATHPSWSSTSCDDGYLHLAPVEQLEPNPWHLHDLYGNAREWVWDWYGPYPEAAAVDAGGPPQGKHRVVRGGSYRDHPEGARSSSRWFWHPRKRRGYIGFRVARSESGRRSEPQAPTPAP